MQIKEHNRNQKRMYRIHKQEEKIQDLELLVGKLQQENKQLKEQLSVAQTNEETFRLEMEDITKTLGLDENTLFDDVKVCVKNLKDNWNKLKEYMKKEYDYLDKYSTPAYGCAMGEINRIKNKMQELQGSNE